MIGRLWARWRDWPAGAEIRVMRRRLVALSLVAVCALTFSVADSLSDWSACW